ncbi:hypothetical protein [Olivibacter sitiensis]|uniref:hypothetical protein n=1 Tax=Olivibacter sitiensis TaxID=376470 RepID=UPI00040BB19A|nr:hypothetical protein [Olivibacter sitiensis]
MKHHFILKAIAILAIGIAFWIYGSSDAIASQKKRGMCEGFGIGLIVGGAIVGAVGFLKKKEQDKGSFR